MMPSAAELTYFSEVANSLNVSRAAKKLGLSQPSLSLAIKRLEETIGTHLFIRHKQGVTLTQAGKKLLQHVKQLQCYWENTKSHALALHQDVQGQVILGCHSTIAFFISGFFPDFFEAHPKLKIHLKNDISRNTTENVINASVDIGIVINPFKHPDLIIRKLNNTEMTFWTGLGKRKIQNIYSDQAVIICDPEVSQTQLLLKKLKIKNKKLTRIITVNSLEIIATLTANGGGIGILPSCFARTIYPDTLKQIPKMPVCSDEICLIYRHENKNVQAIQAVIVALKEFLKDKL